MRHTPSFQQTQKSLALPTLLVSAVVALSGCASTLESDPKYNPADPYENFNRSMHNFNMGFDEYLLKPVADGYDVVTPDFLQARVSSFFNNLKGFNVTLNDLLQGKFDQGASDFGRFMTNSTIGVVGFFDVASDFGMKGHNEDFGQTLATWGVDSGPYLVLPVLGPTSPRDGLGSIFDRAANPGTYLPGTGVVEVVNERRVLDPAIEATKESVDPYVFVREGYMQNRNYEIKDGNVDNDSYQLELDERLSESGSKSKATGSASSSAKNNGSSGKSFDQTSKTFDQVTDEYQEASDKLDRLSKKRFRHKRNYHR